MCNQSWGLWPADLLLQLPALVIEVDDGIGELRFADRGEEKRGNVVGRHLRPFCGNRGRVGKTRRLPADPLEIKRRRAERRVA